MKAWAVTIIANCGQHGTSVGSYFLLGNSRAEAISGAVRTMLENSCPTTVINLTQAFEVSAEVIREAAEQLTPSESA